MAYKYHVGQPFVYPRNELGYTENFLRMCFLGPGRGICGESGAGEGAGHASSSCMPITSRMPRPRPCVWPVRRAPIRSPASRRVSPACGARPMAAPTKRRSRCCEEIGTVDRIPEYIAKAPRTRTVGFRLMGFGHRVYKNYDPRAKAMQIQAHAVLNELGPARRSAAEGRHRAREKWRSAIPISSRRSSIPISTSIRASR